MPEEPPWPDPLRHQVHFSGHRMYLHSVSDERYANRIVNRTEIPGGGDPRSCTSDTGLGRPRSKSVRPRRLRRRRSQPDGVLPLTDDGDLTKSQVGKGRESGCERQSGQIR